MKKTVLVLILVIVFGLSACTGGSGGNSTLDKKEITVKNQDKSKKETKNSSEEEAENNRVVDEKQSENILEQPEFLSRYNEPVSDGNLQPEIEQPKRVNYQEDEIKKELEKMIAEINNEAKVLTENNMVYSFGYGISDNNDNKQVTNITYSNGNFNNKQDVVSLDVHNLLYGDDVNDEIQTRLDGKTSFTVSYGDHSFLGRTENTTFAFGIKTSEEDFKKISIPSQGIEYNGTSIVWFKNNDTNEVKAGRFRGTITDTNKRITGYIYIEEQRNPVVTVNFSATLNQGTFSGNAKGKIKETNINDLKVSGQLNGKNGEGITGVITGSDKIGAGFAGSTTGY